MILKSTQNCPLKRWSKKLFIGFGIAKKDHKKILKMTIVLLALVLGWFVLFSPALSTLLNTTTQNKELNDRLLRVQSLVHRAKTLRQNQELMVIQNINRHELLQRECFGQPHNTPGDALLEFHIQDTSGVSLAACLAQTEVVETQLTRDNDHWSGKVVIAKPPQN